MVILGYMKLDASMSTDTMLLTLEYNLELYPAKYYLLIF
jgi:hypothetical protein